MDYRTPTTTTDLRRPCCWTAAIICGAFLAMPLMIDAASDVGKKAFVPYTADYVFYRP